MNTLLVFFALITGISMGFILGLLNYKRIIKELKEE